MSIWMFASGVGSDQGVAFEAAPDARCHDLGPVGSGDERLASGATEVEVGSGPFRLDEWIARYDSRPVYVEDPRTPGARPGTCLAWRATVIFRGELPLDAALLDHAVTALNAGQRMGLFRLRGAEGGLVETLVLPEQKVALQVCGAGRAHGAWDPDRMALEVAPGLWRGVTGVEATC